MTLPHGNLAVISVEKVTGYLLSLSHPVGRAKAKLFYLHGYRVEDAGVLLRDLMDVAVSGHVVHNETSPYGTKYVVEGRLETPRGSSILVHTVWIIEVDSTTPRLVTVYPA